VGDIGRNERITVVAVEIAPVIDQSLALSVVTVADLIDIVKMKLPPHPLRILLFPAFAQLGDQIFAFRYAVIAEFDLVVLHDSSFRLEEIAKNPAT
jgi:hypothetical protein